MMFVVAIIVAVITICVSIMCIVKYVQRSKQEKENIVWLPFYSALTGIIGSMIFCVPMVICAANKDWTFILFALFVTGCNSLMVAYLNCVIQYDNIGFTARNFWGVHRQCNYADIEGMRIGNDCRLYFTGHSILIDRICIGKDKFLKTVEIGYRRAKRKKYGNVGIL